MKLMIASDIHGSAYYCEKMLKLFRKEGADKLLLLGDLLYHGARNALPRDYSTQETAKLLNGAKEHILCIKGNCDSEVDTLVLEFPVEADFAYFTVAGHSAVAAHGHKVPAHLRKGDFLFTFPPSKNAKTAFISTADPYRSPKKTPHTPAFWLRTGH